MELCQDCGRALGRSSFLHEAVTLGIDAAIARREDGQLPPVPTRLPTRPRRRAYRSPGPPRRSA